MADEGVVVCRKSLSNPSVSRNKCSTSTKHRPWCYRALCSTCCTVLDIHRCLVFRSLTRMRTMKAQTIFCVILTFLLVLLSFGISLSILTGHPRLFLFMLSGIGLYTDDSQCTHRSKHLSVNGCAYYNHIVSLPKSQQKSLGQLDSELLSVRPESACDSLDEDSVCKFTPGFHDTSLSIRHKQRFTASKDVMREAVAAMNIAIDLQAKGRTEKAMKVFQHALALDPSHADVLTAFGEFLEWHIQDIVEADYMYHIALENSPGHGRALQNRERTAPIVEEIDQALFSRVDKKRAVLHSIPNSHPSLRRAKKEAYFAHIYHTNAIEGNTLSLAQTRSIVETRVAVGGKSLQEQNEVLGLDAALSYINSTLVGRIGQLTMQDLLDIHTRVLGYVDPTEAGIFRETQVFVGDFTPPAARDLPELMDQLVLWLNAEDSASLHPIEFAALAHYRLVTIHPFYDGNGRTSRLLMNLILMQAGFPPVSIEVGDRLTYYETLAQGNRGDIRPFIRFIAKCAERTLDGYLAVTRDDLMPTSLGGQRSQPADRIIYADSDTDGEEN